MNKVLGIIKKEEQRQLTQLNLIPSENYTSEAVRSAVGSVLMHKYSEGNVGARYYEGNQFIDELEEYCLELVRKVFKLPEDWGANVQALSGSNANLAAYLAVLQPGDTIMGMHLPDGGHLSHGWSYEPQGGEQVAQDTFEYLGGSNKVNISAKLFNSIQYKTDPETQLLDYKKISTLAKKHKPKLLITGGTAYPRNIDYGKMKEIAESVGALYMADVAHEAGLIAGGVVPSPVGIADIVTLTTHKTLRAARGALILAPQTIIKKVNKAVLPGLQGGPFNNNIAGITAGLEEALLPEFAEYTQKVINNAQTLCTELISRGYHTISGGTDKHLILIDIRDSGLGGRDVAQILAKADIIVNMNTIPGEKRKPNDPSGIRLGTPFVTSLGLGENEMIKIAELIDSVLKLIKEKGAEAANSAELAAVKREVANLTKLFKPR